MRIETLDRADKEKAEEVCKVKPQFPHFRPQEALVRQAAESSDISVDLKELFVRVEFDRELLDDVFQIFRQEFPKLQFLLKDALVRGDLKQVQSSAHTLKGMLSSMSFNGASASAMRIERMAKVSDLAGILLEVTCMESSTTSAQASLERFCERIAR